MSKMVPVLAGARMRELWLVILVTLLTVLAATFVNAGLNRAQNVVAEELGWSEGSAVPGFEGTQVLKLDEWGVQFTLPLAVDMPQMKYAMQPSLASVGLTSSDLEQLGPECKAGKNALGAFVRHPAGSFGTTVQGTSEEHFVATVGAYDYVYRNPTGGCQALPGAGVIVNRELSILLHSLESFGPVSK